MSLVPFLVVSFGAGGLSLLARREPRVSALIGGVGFVLALATATFVRDGSPIVVGGLEVASSAATGSLLLVGVATGGLLVLIAAATGWLPALPGATLIALAAGGVAMSLTDAGSAVIVATAGAVAALLATDRGPTATVADRNPPALARQLRVVVGAGLLALVALAVAGGPLALGRVDAALTGLVWLAVAAAVALRLAAVPFHLSAARLADAAPMLALPLVLAVAPAVLALVAFAWSAAAVEPALTPLGLERSVLAVMAVLTIGFGAIATLVHGDLGHVVTYAFVAEAGVALLAFVGLDATAVAPLGAWLIAWIATRSALAAWAAAAASTWQTSRLGDLDGWARRSPLLAVALALAAAASIGWPGAAIAAARANLVALVADGPAGAALLVLAIAPSIVFVRLFVVGLRRPSQPVAGGPSPSSRPGRRTSDRGPTGVATTMTDYRAPIAAGGVLALAVLAVLVSGGAFGP